MDKKAQRRFTKGGNPGVKTCVVCGKRTWASKGALGSPLCESCYNNAGRENTHSDEGHEGSFADCKVCRA